MMAERLKRGTTALVLLQNAWSGAYAGGTWPRESWLPALRRSQTGRRLAIVFDPADPAVWYDNTTELVGEEPDSVVPIDWRHCEELFRDRAGATFLLACGAQAHLVARRLWPGRYILIPHPAWRFLADRTLARVREIIDADRFQRVRVMQYQEGIRIQPEFTGPFAKDGLFREP